MSARVYFMKRVSESKDVCVMSPQDEQLRWTSLLNQRIILKDEIEFVTEFPCLLGHPVTSY